MDPLLSKIEALAEPGCYSLTFALGTGEHRELVIRMRGDEPIVPAANSFEGWTPGSRLVTATIAVVRALHQARQGTGGSAGRLVDVEGGWDVGIGNVVLSADGVPTCVGHGELAPAGDGVFRCETCGAAARYDRQS
ncbi:hypothetical protein [Jatrophihabitans sp.]|uniref:hypothetical protein n=1 Tax=Jatrophihabitans sp. TaxID=1932789 RepID=UPI002F11C12E